MVYTKQPTFKSVGCFLFLVTMKVANSASLFCLVGFSYPTKTSNLILTLLKLGKLSSERHGFGTHFDNLIVTAQ